MMNAFEESIRSHVRNHRLPVMVLGSVVISVVLVAMALALYYSSGASQLDLSRPGYTSIRDQVKSDDDFKGFNSSGELDDNALSNFESMYESKLKELDAVDAFGADVLSPAALQIEK